MKPIEPGCLCVIIRSKAGHTGRSLRVLGLSEQPRGMSPVIGPWWKVDCMLPCITVGGSIGRYDNNWPESYLMRIDGHEPETQDVPAELEVGA